MPDTSHMETFHDPLTDDEIRELGQELAEVEKAKQATRAERKATLAEIASRVNLADERIAELTSMITSKTRPVEVEVYSITKPGSEYREFFRSDKPPGEPAIRREKLTWLERQESFGFGDDRPEPER